MKAVITVNRIGDAWGWQVDIGEGPWVPRPWTSGFTFTKRGALRKARRMARRYAKHGAFFPRRVGVREEIEL